MLSALRRKRKSRVVCITCIFLLKILWSMRTLTRISRSRDNGDDQLEEEDNDHDQLEEEDNNQDQLEEQDNNQEEDKKEEDDEYNMDYCYQG